MHTYCQERKLKFQGLKQYMGSVEIQMHALSLCLILAACFSAF